ncbi:hypothetical protein Nepgr_003970 [Nepenthes gracilis]|uniref:Uncharacterized protein n=1 Tax=Nepenthes gracilis TaxID=150966 RepID=A0AAD3XEQ1_NEPGR|nr:hypothetical protein Nepgr_003970 [Nepenthes gracilis]
MKLQLELASSDGFLRSGSCLRTLWFAAETSVRGLLIECFCFSVPGEFPGLKSRPPDGILDGDPQPAKIKILSGPAASAKLIEVNVAYHSVPSHLKTRTKSPVPAVDEGGCKNPIPDQVLVDSASHEAGTPVNSPPVIVMDDGDLDQQTSSPANAECYARRKVSSMASLLIESDLSQRTYAACSVSARFVPEDDGAISGSMKDESAYVVSNSDHSILDVGAPCMDDHDAGPPHCDLAPGNEGGGSCVLVDVNLASVGAKPPVSESESFDYGLDASVSDDSASNVLVFPFGSGGFHALLQAFPSMFAELAGPVAAVICCAVSLGPADVCRLLNTKLEFPPSLLHWIVMVFAGFGGLFGAE